MFQTQHNPFTFPFINQPFASVAPQFSPYGVAAPFSAIPQYPFAPSVPVTIPTQFGQFPLTQIPTVFPWINQIASLAYQTFVQNVSRIAHEVAQKTVYQALNELMFQKGAQVPSIESRIPGMFPFSTLEPRTPWGQFPTAQLGAFQPTMAQSPLPFLNVQGVPMQNPSPFVTSPTSGQALFH
jgi:hypothetical protein